MGAALGLLLGLGLWLIWSSRREPAPRPVADRPGRLRRLLDEAGLSEVPTRGVLTLCAGIFVAVLLLGLVVSRALPVAAVFAGLACYAPVAVLRGRARRRQRELADVWPDAVDNLASAVRAGLSLPESLIALSDRGPDALRPAFARFAVDYQVTGQFGESLDRLKTRLADPVGDRVVEALRVAREVGGGDLGRLLRSLSGFLRDEARTRAELESRQAWTINGARLAVSAPWLVLLFMCFQPDAIRRYSSPTGTVILVVGAAVCVVAYRLMMRIGRLPVESRILG